MAIANIGIDFSQAEIPERSYYADYCDVKKERSGTCLTFGKLVPGTNALRTQVEVSYPDTFFWQLWVNMQDMWPKMQANMQHFALEPIGEVTATDKVQTFRANTAYLGTMGEEALADFYYLSPRDLHGVTVGVKREAGLQPVLRVVMSIGLMFEFFEKCKTRAEELKQSQKELGGAKELIAT